MLGMGIISPFLPIFAKQHGANGFWLGMIFAGFGFSRAIVMPFIGRVSDKVGRKIFVVSGLFLYVVIAQFYLRAGSVYQLTLVRMLQGLAAGMILPIVMAYVGDLAEKGKEGQTTGLLNTVFYLGLATGPFLGGILHSEFGFDTVFHVMSVLGVIAFLVVVLFLPEIKRAKKKKTEKRISFNSLIKYNFIKAVLIISVVCPLMTAVLLSFLPSLASKINVDTRHIGIIISVGVLLAGVLQVPFGRLADRFDPIGKLIQVGAGVSVGMFALLEMPSCPDFSALLIAGAFLGLGAAISTPALTSISVGIGHKAGMGFWMGIFYAAMSVGMVITPLVSGIIMDHMGIDSVFYTLALVAFFGSLAYIYYVSRRLRGHQQG